MPQSKALRAETHSSWKLEPRPFTLANPGYRRIVGDCHNFHLAEAIMIQDNSVPLLEVKNLVVDFAIEKGSVRALSGISFSVRKGETIGLVGESGCGKSVSAMSIMRLLPQPHGKIAEGEILFNGEDIVKMKPKRLHELRGHRIGMIFQEPMTALNPVLRVGQQIEESFLLHFPEMNSAQRRARALELMQKVGIPEPEKRLDVYPHQLSGGMRQRVMIAMALACEPDLLIADEPTTALDVTIQAQILELIKKLQRENGMAVIFITHDLGVVANFCDRVAVMYAGRIVEEAPVADLFKSPAHPYSRGLMKSIPLLTHPQKTRLDIIKGQVPALADMPKGCRFANRCPHATSQCESTPPPEEQVSPNHRVACFEWRKLRA